MSINIADPRTLWKVVQDDKRPAQFLRDTFFPDGETMPTELIDIDYVDSNRYEPVYVAPIDDGLVMTKDGFERRTFTAPYLKLIEPITYVDLQKAMAGEDPYNPSPVGAKLAALQAKALGKAMVARDRAIEVQCARALQTGYTTIYRHVKGVTAPVATNQVDWFPSAFRTTHIETSLATTDLWDNASVNILELLATKSRLCMNDCGIRPDVLVMGTSLVPYFFNDTMIKAYLDNRRYDLGGVDPRVYDNRATYIGMLRYADLQLEVWSYSEIYNEPTAGAATNMLDAKKYILGRRGGATIAYGAIQNLAAVMGNPAALGGSMDAGRMFTLSWMTQDGKSLLTQMESSPCACLPQPKAFYCGNGLTL